MAWLDVIEKNGIDFEWDGSTLLGEAIKAGRVDMVEALIKDKADVNRPALYVNYIGQTIGLPPLILTAGGVADAYLFGINVPKEEASMIRYLLLKAGANVKTDLYDILLIAMVKLDEPSFDVALAKYSKDMLDYSSYGRKELESFHTPFSAVFDDEQFDRQKSMLQKLMSKGIQFGFYDIQKALEMYLNPNLNTYYNEFLEGVLEYMTNQNSFVYITEEPDRFDENNPQYINPLDLAINRIFVQQEGSYNITTTNPILYLYVTTLFGDAGLRATPYNWSMKDYYHSGTLPLFLRIIARKISQEIKHRNPNGYIYSSEEQNAEVYEDWTPVRIINAFEILNKYDALYHSLEEENSHPNPGYPPDYLYKQILEYANRSTLPYDDLFEPYYPVFEWLEKNGYLRYGVKEYLTYEDGLSRSEFFSTYESRMLDKNTIPNDRYAQNGVTIDTIERRAMTDPLFRQFILPEAREIIAGTRRGFSNEVRRLLSDRLGTTNLRY
jgi:hypothetical protein